MDEEWQLGLRYLQIFRYPGDQLLTFSGDALGNIILFDPARGESITARTIFDPLCTIAPTADCKAFALGYIYISSWIKYCC
jgi:hypothetical protein